MDKIQAYNLGGAVSEDSSENLFHNTSGPVSSFKNKFWLKQESFKITNSLAAKMQDLSGPEQQALCYIQNKVIQLSKGKNPSLFVNIGAAYFKERLGKHYKGFLLKLVELGELDVNGSYSTSNHFPKSFRIPLISLASRLTTRDYKKKRLRVVRDRSTAVGPLIEYFQSCFSQLTVSDIYIAPSDVSQDDLVKRGLRCVLSGVANWVYGEYGGRLFHSIIQMPSEGRVNIVHKAGKEIAEFDYKTCHPHLLISLCGETEKAKYAEFVNENDVYDFVTKKMGETKPRQLIKKDFLRFFNGGIKNYVYKFYAKEFPGLTETMMGMGKIGVTRYLQNLESEIVVKTLGAACQRSGLFFVPEHDGWIGLMSEGEEISKLLFEIVKDKIGYYPQIKFKPLILNAKEQTFNMENTKEVQNMYDTIKDDTNNILIKDKTIINKDKSLLLESGKTKLSYVEVKEIHNNVEDKAVATLMDNNVEDKPLDADALMQQEFNRFAAEEIQIWRDKRPLIECETL